MLLVFLGTGLLAALALERNCVAIDESAIMLQHLNGRFHKFTGNLKQGVQAAVSEDEVSDGKGSDGEQSDEDAESQESDERE